MILEGSSTFNDGSRRGKSRFVRMLKWLGILSACVLVIGGTAGYLYWRQLKTTPQYSLALVVDSARRHDQETIDQLIDIDAVVDDFIPQVTGKAVEIYGRGVPSTTIERLTVIAAPLLPAIKTRASAELPSVIREKTSRFEGIPFVIIVIAAGEYLDIAVTGEHAEVNSKIEDRPLGLKLKRYGERWKIIGVKDDQLAERIARKMGQELIKAASTADPDSEDAERFGIRDLQKIMKQADILFR